MRLLLSASIAAILLAKEMVGSFQPTPNCGPSARFAFLPTKRRVDRHSCRTIVRLNDSTTPPDADKEGADDDDQWKGKDIYQRVFYRFSPGSEVSQHNALVVEERCRFTADPERPGYVLPVGKRTLILRDGKVEDGEIGNDFFTLSVEDNHEKVHNGAGNDLELQAAIATAMYLACNPDLCAGEMLEVACDLGLASLLGCIGAGFVKADPDSKEEDITDDILTISKGDSGVFPKDLDLLVLSDSDEERLNTAFHNVKHTDVPSSRVSVEVLDWRIRHARPRVAAPLREYRTIVASDVAFTYPEAKELARSVAHRLQPLPPPSMGIVGSSSSSSSASSLLPTFVHVCPDDREDMTYLRRILEKGYRMTAQTHYLKLEKLLFHFQKLPAGESENALDDVELELLEFKEIKFQSLTAQHHPDYAGGGSGELFFPVETGEYEVTGGSTFLEKEAGMDPW